MRSKFTISALLVASLFGSTLIASAQSQPAPGASSEGNVGPGATSGKKTKHEKGMTTGRASAAVPTKATRRIHRVKATLIPTPRAVLVRNAAASIDILSRVDGAFESKGPGAVRGLTFKNACSHRPNSRPASRLA